MNILFASCYGDSADIAFRMGLDGHKVQLYIEDPKYAMNFDGVVPKTTDWKKAAAWADLIVFDDNKLPHIWQACHRSVPCFGGGPFGTRLEEDRAFAHGVMERVGIPRLESKTFKTLREVIPHLKEHKTAHVIKPQGDKVESHHLIVGQDWDNADAIDQVERLIEQGLAVDAVEVEEKKTGVETGVSFWFNGREPVGPINFNFEHKRSNDRESGYLTCEMGTLMRYSEDPDLPLYKDTLAKMIPVLRAADYRGQLDLTMMVTDEPDENGNRIFPLEFTPRLGKPAVFIEDELHVTPWADLFAACANGENPGLQVRYEWAAGVVLAAFGFPFEDQANKISSGLVIKGLDEHSLEHVHPWQARLDRKGRFVVGGGNGMILTATGRGATVMDAKDRAYNALAGVRVPNSFNRWDITDKIDTWRLENLGILPVEA